MNYMFSIPIKGEEVERKDRYSTTETDFAIETIMKNLKKEGTFNIEIQTEEVQ